MILQYMHCRGPLGERMGIYSKMAQKRAIMQAVRPKRIIICNFIAVEKQYDTSSRWQRVALSLGKDYQHLIVRARQTARFQRARTARFTAKWDEAALSFKIGGQRFELWPYTPFGHVLLTFWSFAKDTPTFNSVSSTERS
jgi:hypothetical protein